MKVMVRSDKVPISLMLAGLSMATVSQMTFVKYNHELLFASGWMIAGLGFLLWAIPAFNKYMKKKEKARMRERKASTPEGEPRRYARPRR
ncbi:MAG TPA: hypothetical protein ENK47_07630 [Euryarchaeota archaeon]|nr:hypothetical protein [Euryarchaeota archaeon]